MSKRGLPTNITMRHDSHFVEELARTNRSIGRIIPINKIEPNPDQPRVEIGDLAELTGSIKQQGVLEPLLVKPNKDTGTWMIIAGERRWRAANLAGLTEVPCIELDIDEKSIAEIALVENLQRKDLTIWEEADGLAHLNERYGYTHEEIAKKIGKSRTTVTEALTIAGLPEDIRKRCRQSNITAKSLLLEIARQFDEKAMQHFLDKIDKKDLTREQIRQIARPNNRLPSDQVIKNDARKLSGKIPDPGFKESQKNTFQYSSAKNSFALEIRFDKDEAFERNDLLRALKEVFDKIKAEK